MVISAKKHEPASVNYTVSMIYLAFNVILKVVCSCNPSILVLAGAGCIDEDRFFHVCSRGNMNHHNKIQVSSSLPADDHNSRKSFLCHPLVITGDQPLKTSEISSLQARPCSWGVTFSSSTSNEQV